jgi:hypothetical protein
MSIGLREGLPTMTMTTRVLSVSVPVTDQDAASSSGVQQLRYRVRSED